MMSQDEQWLLQEKYQGERTDAFYADCKRLALGEPLAYLIGFAPFLGCKIWLDSKPLIPRPETEYWVEKFIHTVETRDVPLHGFSAPPPHILDLCAGSGCIGIAIASTLKNSHVDFGEIDKTHLATIEKNLTENTIERERYTIYHSNLFANIQHTYDYIVSNPPYIDRELQRVDESVALHEPHLALFGGRGGTEVIADIIAAAPAHLKTGGQLWLEHEPEQVVILEKLAEAHHFTIETHTDQYNLPRYSILVLQ